MCICVYLYIYIYICISSFKVVLWPPEALDSVYMSRAERGRRLGNFGSLGRLPFDLLICSWLLGSTLMRTQPGLFCLSLYANRFSLDFGAADWPARSWLPGLALILRLSVVSFGL